MVVLGISTTTSPIIKPTVELQEIYFAPFERFGVACGVIMEFCYCSYDCRHSQVVEIRYKSRPEMRKVGEHLVGNIIWLKCLKKEF